MRKAESASKNPKANPRFFVNQFATSTVPATLEAPPTPIDTKAYSTNNCHGTCTKEIAKKLTPTNNVLADMTIRAPNLSINLPING